MDYNVQEVEKKWREIWAEKKVGYALPSHDKKKFYCLDMWPYPSGSGLHVGHWRGYVISDVFARMALLKGYNVLHPMGWDAFGLPAENDAIKKGIHPNISVPANIKNFKKQLADIGALYDWSKEINTTDPNYYKWTQWIFLQMFKAGLAYQADMPINWCPSCLTGLANEEVVNGGCERCGTKVEQKKIRQWVLKITAYAEKLLDGLEKLDWPEKVKTMQRNWIGKSEGLELIFNLETPSESIDIPVFTTRPDTLYGVTFLAIAYDHDLVSKIVYPEYKAVVEEFQKKVLEEKQKEKYDLILGVFTGTYGKHPITGEKIPVYLANYVLKDYASGAVMGVPAHDQRDFEFAKLYNLPVKQVIASPDAKLNNDGTLSEAYEGEGVLIKSEIFDKKKSEQAKKLISENLIKKGIAKKKVAYKFRDWIFSRQRYWGEPIPIIHCAKCGVVPVDEKDLPVKLPDIEKYQPTGTGESPLANVTDWVNTKCPKCGGPAKRETNTMPQWAGSSWYFLRYPDAHLEDKPFSSESLNYWLPVDLYVGGIEHAVLHLLYSRFYVKVLHDLGYLPFDEPFKKLFNQGMIGKYSEKTGAVEKMAKSKGNIVNPDDIVKTFGSDALRLYELFIGPAELDVEWQDSGLEGCRRFLMKFWHFMTEPENIIWDEQMEDIKVKKRVHRLIKDVQERIDSFKTNTVVPAFMEWLNEMNSMKAKLSAASCEKILVMLSTLAPHMCCEILQLVFKKELSDCQWPTYDPQFAELDTIEIVVQVNGKLRGNIYIAPSLEQAEVELIAKESVPDWLINVEIIKVVYVPQRLINFVVKSR